MSTLPRPPHPVVPYPPLLPRLRQLVDSGDLADLWADESAWESLSIDYHPPRVERLYANLTGGLRVMLHRVHPCEPDKALWHSHPWPSAVMLLNGTYEHGTGFVDRNGLHCNARHILNAGACYEITDPLAWHYVRPLDEPAYSVMLVGKPWAKHTAPRPAPQRSLTADEVEDLRRAFGDLLAWKQPVGETQESVDAYEPFDTDHPGFGD